MRLLKRLSIAVAVSWKWDRAAEMAAKGRYEAAMEQILAAERISGGHLVPKFLVLKAWLARRLGDPVLALQYATEAYKQIESNRRLSNAEKRYLECYTSTLGLKLIEELQYDGPHEFAVDYSSVDLDRVWGATKAVFPLPRHPAWKIQRRSGSRADASGDRQRH